MLKYLLPCAVLTAAVVAQPPVLIYDNGTIITRTDAVADWSTLQNTTLGHATYGYGCQKTLPTIDNALFDDFEVCRSGPMIITEAEVYGYQTGGGSASSTITGCYIALYASDPALGAVPIWGSLTDDLFLVPVNPIANTWSNVYRELESLPGSTARAIMRVRVALVTPNGAVPPPLPPGRYWIGIQLAGSLASGPWMPPLCSDNQPVTGNAKQRVTSGLWNDPIVSGTAPPYPQGIPFKFFGPPQPHAAFRITKMADNSVSCGGVPAINVTGSPNIAPYGHIRTNLYNLTTGSFPVIGYDLGMNPGTFCGQQFVHQFPITVFPASTHEVVIPPAPVFCGLPISVQGAELLLPPLPPTGCCNAFANISDGYLVRLQM